MKNTKTSFTLSIIALTLLLTACSGANSGANKPEASTAASTTNTSASTGSPTPSLPVTTPGTELPATTPATPSQPLSPAAAAISSLEANGTIPKLDRSDSLAGPDLDGNGVRDDVDAWIKSKLTDQKQVAAAMQFARAMQKALLVEKGNRIAAKAQSLISHRALDCLFVHFENENTPLSLDRVMGGITSISTNTKERLRAYLEYNKSLNGTTSSLLPISEAISCDAN
jgi:transcriptional antiterminator Rof (Rho-off)